MNIFDPLHSSCDVPEEASADVDVQSMGVDGGRGADGGVLPRLVPKCTATPWEAKSADGLLNRLQKSARQ